MNFLGFECCLPYHKMGTLPQKPTSFDKLSIDANWICDAGKAVAGNEANTLTTASKLRGGCSFLGGLFGAGVAVTRPTEILDSRSKKKLVTMLINQCVPYQFASVQVQQTTYFQKKTYRKECSLPSSSLKLNKFPCHFHL